MADRCSASVSRTGNSCGSIARPGCQSRVWTGSKISQDQRLGSFLFVDPIRLLYVNNRNQVVCFDIAPLKERDRQADRNMEAGYAEEVERVTKSPWICMDSFAASVRGLQEQAVCRDAQRVRCQFLVNYPKPEARVGVPGKDKREEWFGRNTFLNSIYILFRRPVRWSSVFKGKAQVMVGQGDGWLRSFDPATG